MKTVDILIVGAGITGITAASILAREKNKTVLIIEKRHHIGGNCYDCFNEDGILIHLYGPHIFHTQHKDVWDYLSQFTDWLDYVHHVKAFVDGKYISFPININTFEQLFEKSFTKDDVLAYLEQKKIDLPEIKNAEDMVISRMGKTIYDKFFKNYTRKQWGVDAKDLAPEITERIPIRFDRDERFFTDPYQGMPEKGYTELFKAMLDHENIQVITGKDYRDIKDQVKFDKMIYTGPVDEFFDYKYGYLPYRGINFSFKTYDQENCLPVAVVNYPNDHDYTRITEFKHMTFQQHYKTCLCYEYPAPAKAEKDEPVASYPVLDKKSLANYLKYKNETNKLINVDFIGRLGEFKYLNMDACVKNAIDLCG
ncbi:RfbD: UDP-galactopyranose mutase [Desulfobacula toluolica Tol2]|uniref:RfbD: UDP-galactopyranose mutase n=1 Tax=Desulfobacula toluolica (strain DSM 7467 / Tol2) TaxID=651182 RepID=K0NH52_DESTT|nr:UDP-galactopyranose mutase [Desulfobacula toluolica]CCK80300.1 RfbD: UDP-galactopyranose mutase [Desulfobacula toluolica Tol2]